MRNILDHAQISESALKAIENFHTNCVKEVEEAIQQNKFVVVGMRQNPVVKRALKALDAAQISYKYIEHGSYFSMWKQRLAIKLWSGWPTFPMVFIDGKLIGGCNELLIWLKQKN